MAKRLTSPLPLSCPAHADSITLHPSIHLFVLPIICDQHVLMEHVVSSLGPRRLLRYPNRYSDVLRAARRHFISRVGTRCRAEVVHELIIISASPSGRLPQSEAVLIEPTHDKTISIQDGSKQLAANLGTDVRVFPVVPQKQTQSIIIRTDSAIF